MLNDFIEVTYKDHSYSIYKGDSLKTLLNRTELLELPLNIWKTLFDKKDGNSCYDLLYKVLKAKINHYDISLNVNSFYFNKELYWYDKDTRMGLQNLANCSSDKITLVIGDNLVELSVDKAKLFLSLLEVYAGKCFVNTTKHLKNIKELKTIEDLVNYDYTSGYPSKITLKVE